MHALNLQYRRHLREEADGAIRGQQLGPLLQNLKNQSVGYPYLFLPKGGTKKFLQAPLIYYREIAPLLFFLVFHHC